MSSIAVFAYGSNLCIERMRARVASARMRTVATLDGYTLCFHKRGRDGSAKADALATAHPDDRVWGVVYELSPTDKEVLDRIEGVGRGYADSQIRVRCADGAELAAHVYRAQPSHVDPALLPFRWYRDLVAHGAAQHGLPREYRARIDAVRVVEDPDRARHARETSVLTALAERFDD